MMHLHNYNIGLKEKVDECVCVACNCYFFNISENPHTLIDSHRTLTEGKNLLEKI